MGWPSVLPCFLLSSLLSLTFSRLVRSAATCFLLLFCLFFPATMTVAIEFALPPSTTRPRLSTSNCCCQCWTAPGVNCTLNSLIAEPQSTEFFFETASNRFFYVTFSLLAFPCLTLPLPFALYYCLFRFLCAFCCHNSHGRRTNGITRKEITCIVCLFLCLFLCLPRSVLVPCVACRLIRLLPDCM